MNTLPIEHGAERHRRVETTYSEPVTLVDTETQTVLYTGPLSASASTVTERYCANCDAWFEMRGIFGALQVIAEGCPTCHRDVM